jgi:hypothetical protein
MKIISIKNFTKYQSIHPKEARSVLPWPKKKQKNYKK